MKEEFISVEGVSDLLTNARYELSPSEVSHRLMKLKDEGVIDEHQFERIQDEDVELKIRYKTYRKCTKQLFFGIILIVFGLMVPLSFSFYISLSGFILTISSFFGILSNKVTKTQKEYLKS